MGILCNIRRRVFGENWGPAAVAVPKAWKRSRGSGVRVLVIDTGLPRWVSSEDARNFVDEPLEDLSGHATAVCGIIEDWAPKARLACYKALPKSGHAEGPSALRSALVAAAMLRPDVVCCSLAVYLDVSKLHNPIRLLADGGAIVIAGAGNDPSRGIAYPARFEEVISVGACDRSGKAAKFSPDGADILMPGVDIRCPWLRGASKVASGTSLAAAAAAGMAALAVSAFRAQMGGVMYHETARALMARYAGVRPEGEADA